MTTDGGPAIGFDEAGGGERTPLVLLHGVGSDRSVWHPQLDHFAAERRTIAVDYPGYGDSDPVPEGTSRDDYAAVILAAMDSLEIGRAHICGLSLGGIVALAMAHAAPARCASLTLADSFASHPDGQAIYDRSVAASMSGSMRALAEARVDVLIAQPADPAVRSQVIETMARIDPVAYRIGAEAVWLAAQEDRTHDIRCPALVLCGTLDHITPPALSHALAAIIPGARFEAIEGAGHLSNFEQPEAFNTLLGAFIRGVDSRS
ncbi:MAG: alpha/beta fold hydrolase [Sphingomicrobium sp.]